MTTTRRKRAADGDQVASATSEANKVPPAKMPGQIVVDDGGRPVVDDGGRPVMVDPS